MSHRVGAALIQIQIYRACKGGHRRRPVGALIFAVVDLFLPQIRKIKGAGIEIEKSSVTQITTSETLGISK
jgi:hypothetical protein